MENFCYYPNLRLKLSITTCEYLKYKYLHEPITLDEDLNATHPKCTVYKHGHNTLISGECQRQEVIY